jgi:NDP-sugar pyrophosphorylase family protein
MLPVVILCGGLSTRLHALTANKPKSMIGILGKPFIDHQLTLMSENGVTDVILCIGKFGDQINDYVGDGQKWGMSVTYSNDGYLMLGTGGALQNAYRKLPDEFIVTNGDSYLDIDYDPVITRFHHSGFPLLMTIYPVTDPNAYRNVCAHRRKIKIYDKTGKTPYLNYIDYGFTPMKKWLLNHYTDTTFDFSVIYSDLIQRGIVSCYRSPKVFHEIGSYEGLTETTGYIKKTRGI